MMQTVDDVRLARIEQKLDNLVEVVGQIRLLEERVEHHASNVERVNNTVEKLAARIGIIESSLIKIQNDQAHAAQTMTWIERVVWGAGLVALGFNKFLIN